MSGYSSKAETEGEEDEGCGGHAALTDVNNYGFSIFLTSELADDCEKGSACWLSAPSSFKLLPQFIP